MNKQYSLLVLIVSFFFSIFLFQNCGESPSAIVMKNDSSSNSDNNDSSTDNNEDTSNPDESGPTPTPTPVPPVFSSLYDMGSADDERPYDLMQTSDGGFINGGMVQKTPGTPDSQDILFTKWNSNGTLAYSRLIDGGANDQAFAVEELQDGYLAIGLSNSYQPNGSYIFDEALMVKLNKANGTVMFTKKISGPGRDDIRGIDAITDAGGNPALIGVGRTSTGRDDPENGLVVKMDTDGNILWQTAVGDTNDQRFYEVVYVPGQGYFAAGYTTDNGQDGIIVKISENGNILASRRMGSTGSDRFFAIENGVNELVIGAKMSGVGFGGGDGALIRMDYNLNLKSAHVIGGANYEEFTDIKALSDGSVILHGMTESVGNGALVIIITKVNAANQLVFTTIWGKGGDDVSYFGGLDIRADGGIAAISMQNEADEKNNATSVRDASLLLLDQYGGIGDNSSCTGVLTNQLIGIAPLNLTLDNITLSASNPGLTVVNLTSAAVTHNVQQANQCTAP